MPRGVSNITSGTRRNKLEGLVELQKRIVALQDATVGQMAAGVLRDASVDVLQDVVDSAKRQNVPHEAMQDIFAWSPTSPGKPDRALTSLVGVRKRGRANDAKGYVTWYPGRQVGRFEKTTRMKKRGGALVLPGFRNSKGNLQKIGENLATMWEIGTTKMRPRPFFRPVISSVRARVLGSITTGFAGIVEKFAK